MSDRHDRGGGVLGLRPSVPGLLGEQAAIPRHAFSFRLAPWRWTLRAVRSWDFALAAVGLLGAGVALWVTLGAGFLAYPGWLAVQKADFILGPIAVGLYWRHRRPANRLGLLLIALGLSGLPYILASVTNPTWFGIGVLAETPIYVVTVLVILAFPTGRLDRISKWLMIVLVVPGVAMSLVLSLTAPNLGPGFSISGCRSGCPANGLAIWSPPTWLPQLADALGVLLVALPSAMACLLVWRFLSGSPPRRRAMAIGGPLALLFLLMQVTYRTIFLVSANGLAPGARPAQDALQWTFAGARALVWYGFLLALIGAELYAGRVMRRLVSESLGRPSFRELEEMLSGPLGDPGLRLGFWRGDTSEWVDADGALLAGPRSGQHLSEIDRDGRAVIAIIHDKQLVDDPELLRAAGAVALLALENAEIESAWRASLGELANSRARIVRASETERRKLERDLHDGAQQRLLAVLLRLSAAREDADDPELRRKLDMATSELEEGLAELRALAHGIYPTALANSGLTGALRALSIRSGSALRISQDSEREFAPEVEAALYYCCLEALQNASKHAGPAARTTIRLFTAAQELHLEVCDDGSGFDGIHGNGGVGLQNMRDRLGAVGGSIEISSSPGAGTVVSATAPCP